MAQNIANVGPVGPATGMQYYPVGYSAPALAATTTAATLVSGTTIFTITGGPLLVTNLVSLCVTANDTTASTIRWSADATIGGTATTFTGASATLASLAAGDMVICNFTALATAPDIMSTGTSAALGAILTRGIILQAGIITTTIAVGLTTGTWNHILSYVPLSSLTVVTPAF